MTLDHQTREIYLREMGLSPLWKLRNALVPPCGQSMPINEPSPEALPARAESAVPSGGLDWDGLQTAVSACTACGLCRNRKQAVLGVGDRQPDWLFIGEGPGAEEDERGEPFVGQAGRLLDAMLASIGLQRGNKVYIANAVKCRPPNNRTPEPEELAACRPYLARQIELLRPKRIVLLGRTAVNSVLQNDRALASLRGKRFTYCDIPVVITYHPAYLLRNLPDKARAWEDLCFARAPASDNAPHDE